MKKAIFVFIALHLVSMLSHAQNRGGNPTETRLQQLERKVYELEQRLNRLENGGGGRPAPYTEIACMVTAEYTGEVSLGKGRLRTEAESNALQACATKNPASYCKQVKCSDGQSPSIRGAFCSVSAMYTGEVFKGEGKNLIEAEYAAKALCQKSKPASYCKVEPRCETY